VVVCELKPSLFIAIAELRLVRLGVYLFQILHSVSRRFLHKLSSSYCKENGNITLVGRVKLV